MTGKKEKSREKRCPLCGGGMHDGDSVIPFLIRDKIIIIKGVPAEICLDCGEPYMKSSVISQIESLLDKLDDLQSEVSVVLYKVA